MLLKSLRLVIVLILILNSGSIIFLQNEKLNILLPIFVFLLYFLHFHTKFIYNIKIPIKLILFICFILIFINIFHIFYLQTSYSLYSGLIIKVTSIVLFLLYYKNKYNSFRKLTEDIYIVLKFVLLLSVLNIFMPYMLKPIFQLSDVGVYVNTFHGIFNYISSINIGEYNIYRNQGLFWEPGVLQIFINVLLYMSLFVYKNIKTTLISIIIILSTFSTTGILIMSLVLVTYFMKAKSSQYKLLGLSTTLIVLLPLAGYALYDKFTGDSALSSSLRMYDFYIGIQVYLDNFFIGIGFNPDLYLELQRDISQSFISIQNTRGNTNGILTIGIYFGFLIFIYIYMLSKQKIFEDRYLIFLILFLSLLSEPLSLSSFLLIIVLSSFFNRESLFSHEKIYA